MPRQYNILEGYAMNTYCQADLCSSRELAVWSPRGTLPSSARPQDHHTSTYSTLKNCKAHQKCLLQLIHLQVSVSLYIHISLCISSCLSHRHCSCNRVPCNPCWRTSRQALQKLLSQDEGISGVKTVRDTFNLHPRSIHFGNNISTSRTKQKCD